MANSKFLLCWLIGVQVLAPILCSIKGGGADTGEEVSNSTGGPNCIPADNRTRVAPIPCEPNGFQEAENLFTAVVDGDLSEVQRHISLGADVEARDATGATPLYWAMSKGFLSTAEALLDAGANMNDVDISGWAPMHWISFYGDSRLTKILMSRGVNVGPTTTETQVHIWHHIRKHYVLGSTPLDISSLNGHVEVVELLLSQGAMSPVENGVQNTALHKASMCGHASVVQALLKAGADPRAVGVSLWTPLHHAANSAVAQILIEAGADIDAKDANEGTPLVSAGTRGVFGPAKALIEAGANVKMPNRFGWTPLHAFAHNCPAPEAIPTLIAAGADVYARAGDASSALYSSLSLSSHRGHLHHCVEALVTAGSDINQTGSAGWNLLHWATYHSDITLVDMLIGKGIDREAQSTKGIHYYKSLYEHFYHGGSTPLHIGAIDGNYDIVEALLQHGANKEAQNSAGLAPRDVVPEDHDEVEHIMKLLK